MDDDERLRAFVREELDRREAEEQRTCLHPEGMIYPGAKVKCMVCRKVMDQDDLDDAYAGPEPQLSAVEQKRVGWTA